MFLYIYILHNYGAYLETKMCYLYIYILVKFKKLKMHKQL